MGAFSRGVLLGMAGLALVIQFIRPARTNPPIDPSRTLEAAVTVPPQEAKILSRACADCHSNPAGSISPGPVFVFPNLGGDGGSE